MKKLFTLILAVVAVMSAGAVERTLPQNLSGFSGWSDDTKYSSTDNTLTFAAYYGGGDVWGMTEDVSNYTQFVMKLQETCEYSIAVTVQYTETYLEGTDTKHYQTSKTIEAGSTEAVIDLEYKSIYCITIQLMANATSNVTIKAPSLYFYYKDSIEAKVTSKWSGTQECTSGWQGAVQIDNTEFSNCVAGDKVRVHVTELTEGGQVNLQYISNDSWTNFDPDVNYVFTSTDTAPMDVELTLTADMLSKINAATTTKFIVKGQSYTFTDVSLVNYVQPTAKLTQTLNEGSITPNWDENWNQPASVINALKAGDVLTVTVSAKSGEWPKFYIQWGSENTQKVEVGCWNDTDFPHDYPLSFTADQIAAIQAAGKLYINGCNVTITKFTLTHKGVTPNTACEGYITYYNCYDTNVQAPEGYTVYTATKKDDSTILLTSVDDRIIPAGSAAIIKGATTDSYVMTATTEATSATEQYASNIIKGVTNRMIVKFIPGITSTNYIYVLSHTDADGTAFYRYSVENYLPAGKCYIDLGTVDTSNQAKAVKFSFGETPAPTVINQIENGEQKMGNNFGKFIHNGQIVIVNDGKKFNVNGQEVK